MKSIDEHRRQHRTASWTKCTAWQAVVRETAVLDPRPYRDMLDDAEGLPS